MTYRISAHARDACRERGILLADVESVLANPEQTLSLGHDKQVYQSRVTMNGEQFLLRVVIGLSTYPPTVVTAYRTRKIAKYWST